MRFLTAYSSTCYLFYSAVLYSFLMCQVCGLTMWPFSIMSPVYLTDIFIFIVSSIIIFIIGHNDTTSNDLMHSFLNKNDVTNFHFICELLCCMSSIFIRKTFINYFSHFDLHCIFTIKCTQISNFSPTDGHYT